MSTLILNPIVLSTLRKAHPKPASSARRLLLNYVAALQEEIELAKLNPRSVFENNPGTYVISASRLFKKSGQFGPKGTRIHTWLKQNMPLYESIITGTNFNKKLSLIKLTDLVMEVDDDFVGPHITVGENIVVTAERYADKIANEFRQMMVGMTTSQRLTAFHSTPVDMDSLSNYIQWLEAHAYAYPELKRKARIRQANYVRKIANHFDGKFLQKVHWSDFGRCYYKHISIQNISKDLRSAVLGNCWEYDVSSSATAWKLSHAEEYLRSVNSTATVDEAFSVTIGFLTEKPRLMGDIQDYTFTPNCPLTPNEQLEKIKSGMNALCFGARLNTPGFRFTGSGSFEPALVQIFKDPEERNRFTSCPYVTEFVREQNLLDKYLYAKVKREQPDLLVNDIIKAPKNPTKSKVIAWLYQHAETKNMGRIYEYLSSAGIEVIARVHDAFFVRTRLSSEMLTDIHTSMRECTGIQYFNLGETEIKRWEAVPSANTTSLISDSDLIPSFDQQFAREIERETALQLSALGKRNGDVDMLYAQGGFCT